MSTLAINQSYQHRVAGQLSAFLLKAAVLSVSLSSLNPAKTMVAVAVLCFFGYVCMQPKSGAKYLFTILALVSVLLHTQVLLYFGVSFQIFSVLLVILTYLFFATFDVERTHADNVINFIVKLAIVSVPLAFLISVVEFLGIYRFELNTNYIFGFARLTFLFSEPSHYAIFLAFAFFKAYLLNYTKMALGVLLVGLLFTLSLSGYFIVFLGAVFLGLSRLGKLENFLKFVFALICSIAILVYLYFNFDFWVFRKFDDLVAVLQGGIAHNSAFVRFNSLFLPVHFINDKLQQADYVGLVWGEGFGYHTAWLENYYSRQLGFFEQSESFNLIGSVFVANGLFGAFSYLALIGAFYVRNMHRVSLSALLYFFFVLSFFSGYAYGPLSLVYKAQLFLIAYLYKRYSDAH